MCRCFANKEQRRNPRLSLKRLEQIPHRWHLWFLFLRPGKPQPYGFHIAELPSALSRHVETKSDPLVSKLYSSTYR